MNNDVLPHLQSVIAKNNLGAIVLPVNPSFDAVAAACSLYLGLSKIGKSLSVATENSVDYNLVAVEKIQNNIVANGDNLVISFPYADGAIDKVDYNIQGNLFNLIVTPRAGYPKLDPSQVKYSYSGGKLDFIIVVDAPSLNNLGQIYTNNQGQFQGREIINIDRHLTNALYGTVNYVNKSASSISEMATGLLRQLQIEFDRDLATNLYAGIAMATNNFTSYSVSAETFETIAYLLRAGANKMSFRKIEKQNLRPIQKIEREINIEEPTTPSDWLKPKIFKGSGLI